MRISLSEIFCSVTHKIANSTAMDSAHPISQPSEIQAAQSFHAIQEWFINNPIPHEVEASTQMSYSACIWGRRECEGKVHFSNKANPSGQQEEYDGMPTG
jgi:hypothetical protein